MSIFSIGQVARKTGVGAETIRFYEKEGLLEASARTKSGYRQYNQQSIERIHFIRQAKYLGFTLKEIRELLYLLAESRDMCQDMQQSALLKITEMDQKIAALQALRIKLLNAVMLCDTDNGSEMCPILNMLEHEDIQNLPTLNG